MAATISALRQRMIEDMTIRNLSPGTQRSYVSAVSRFARYFGRSPDKLGPEEVRAFQIHLVSRRLSWAGINQTVCALRFFYGVTLGRRDKVVRFLQAVPSLKHRTALTTAYAAGLRAAETLGLAVGDIDSARMLIHVRNGKGGKDRYVMLSPQLLEVLRSYWLLKRSRPFLFPWKRFDRPLSPGVLSAACRVAALAAGIDKHITQHTLRHSFATHLLESGTDIRVIQVLPGHSSLSITAGYAQVATDMISKTISPFDRLSLAAAPAD